ncbi:NAD(P)H-binding protein [Arthrobacter sp. NEB 688]|uniref:NAD(P)-dependent oxidoreductase n=1 Tax=Arthrobacter sp. NEB 688 TaxID=904039 RepID=UPI001566232E|nr:NAD(P)H-binding protein [Arthrobacter sp. NEB 688]QKE82896.1 NAD(P)H-binding protein [Arthrobacter sp. NEB 688]
MTTTITVLGGTGFAGRHIVDEAASRGHRVVVVSRSATAPEGGGLDGAEYRAVDVADPAALEEVLADASVVVSALSPRGGLDGQLGAVDRAVADHVAQAGGELYVVGGFSSLRRTAGGPRVIEEGMGPVDGIPPEQVAALVREATQMNDVLQDLLARTDDLRWSFLSPGMEFGAHVPGERTGSYRVTDDGFVLTDEDGRTAIGGADFAAALLDEIEADSPRRGHLAVAY